MSPAKQTPAKRNLSSVFEIISGSRFFEFARDAVKLRDPLITGRLGRFAAAGASESRELVSILGTAVQGCRFIGNRPMMQNLSGAAMGQPVLDWKELRKRPTTVYVILPVRYLKPLYRWLRVCINSCLNELLVEEQKGLPTLLLMDEFAALGHLSTVEACMSLSAGMGVTMLPIFQDAGQIKGIYGDDRFDVGAEA